jgi:hypothetical protein
VGDVDIVEGYAGRGGLEELASEGGAEVRRLACQQGGMDVEGRVLWSHEYRRGAREVRCIGSV